MKQLLKLTSSADRPNQFLISFLQHLPGRLGTGARSELLVHLTTSIAVQSILLDHLQKNLCSRLGPTSTLDLQHVSLKKEEEEEREEKSQ